MCEGWMELGIVFDCREVNHVMKTHGESQLLCEVCPFLAARASRGLVDIQGREQFAVIVTRHEYAG